MPITNTQGIKFRVNEDKCSLPNKSPEDLETMFGSRDIGDCGRLQFYAKQPNQWTSPPAAEAFCDVVQINCSDPRYSQCENCTYCKVPPQRVPQHACSMDVGAPGWDPID